MALPVVLVTDTNIWIDLHNGEILPFVFCLPYQLAIPDFAVSELVQPPWDTLRELGLVAYGLDAGRVRELSTLAPKHRRLSVIDLAAYLLAKTLAADLLTGDGQLRQLALENQLTVHGVLWLLDEMLLHQIISLSQAADALRKMLDQGARLPEDECNHRLALSSK